MYYVFGHNDYDGELEQVSVAFDKYEDALKFKLRSETRECTCLYIFKNVTDGEINETSSCNM